MSRREARSRRRTLRVVLLSLAGLALFARRRDHESEPWDGMAVVADVPDVAETASVPEQQPAPRRRSRPRRLAAGFALVLCFFAGAALSAGAGDKATLLLEDEAAEPIFAPEPAPVIVEEFLPPELEEPQALPLEELEGPAPVRAGSAKVSVSAPAAPSALSQASAPAAPAKARAAKPKRKAAAAGSKAPHARTPAAYPPTAPPTVLIPSAGAMWLTRSEPVETPAALKLSRGFADRLAAAARRSKSDWAVVFGVLRARGSAGLDPATAARLRALSMQLAGVRAESNSLSSALAVSDDGLAKRAAALARYAKAVGLETLVEGLEDAGADLAARILADERIDVYEGGRADIALGRIDVRVLALVAYLAETYGQITVSSLTSGHRLYSRPGVLSAHVFGLAVDIAALGGVPIAGNQEPGGITEHAVRAILRLPAELQPKQVISLFGLGGPSFPLADHDDHIHVGY